MKDKNATIIVDLEPSEEEILSSLHKDARWGIGRAKRDGLVVRISNDWEDVYRLYTDTMELGGVKAESLEKLKEGTVDLFVCKKNGRIIGAAGVEMKGEIPTLYFNCSDLEFRSSQPNNILYWACIVWYKGKGHKMFDLGGWQINAQEHLEGINKFKEKWGQIRYSSKEYSIHEAIGRKLIRHSKFFWWLNKKLKGR